MSVTPSESDQALKFTQFGNSLDIGTLSLMALDNSLDIAKNVFSSPYTTIKSPKQRQWNRNMIGGGGAGVTEHFFYLFFSSAGREHSQHVIAVQLPFPFITNSSLQSFPPPARVTLDPRAESIKVFGSGNYVTKLNYVPGQELGELKSP